ncbi:MAG: hypothetical protein IJU81_03200 [Bacteroidales bacterium]|nr:hypothetical protein [Bacteroidales bacterium]
MPDGDIFTFCIAVVQSSALYTLSLQPEWLNEKAPLPLFFIGSVKLSGNNITPYTPATVAFSHLL